MPARRQTSPEVSSLAGNYLRMSLSEIQARMAAEPERVAEHVRRMAASLLAQDEEAEE